MHPAAIRDHEEVNLESTPTRRSHEERLRSTGSGIEPKGRGWLHLGALVLALPAGGLLVWHAGLGGGVGIYALALVALYGVSATYHLGSWSSKARRRFQQLDYITIYVFIAASVTPYCLLGVPGTLSRVVLCVVWIGAAAAVGALIVGFERWRRILASGYLVLGWVPIVTFPSALRAFDLEQLLLFGAMGLLYTSGAVVLAARWPDPAPDVFGYHEVWHAMVVVAGACYFILVWTLAGAPH